MRKYKRRNAGGVANPRPPSVPGTLRPDTVFKDGKRVKLFRGRFFWQRLGCGALLAIAGFFTMAMSAIVASVSDRDAEPLFVIGLPCCLFLPWLVRYWLIERRHLVHAAIVLSEEGMTYWDGPGEGRAVSWSSVDRLRDGFFSLTIEHKAQNGPWTLRMWLHRLWDRGLGDSVLATIRERAELRCATPTHRWLHGLIWSPVVYRRCHAQPEEGLAREPSDGHRRRGL